MDERLFAKLVAWLDHEPVVLASVIDARGATPRKRGARMLIAATDSAFSIGGGVAELRVIDAARRLLDRGGNRDSVAIDLGGGPDAAGICGGRMQVALRRWDGAAERQRAKAIAASLAAGEAVELSEGDLGMAVAGELALPDPRLLIVGAGHCGEALYRLARPAGFDLRVQDRREDCFVAGRYDSEHVICGDMSRLAEAQDTARPLCAVLLNRDFHADIAALEVLCRRPPAFLGMMGSRRRIATVREALPQHAEALQRLVAPVGLDIGAETPDEIAISILAQLVAFRRTQSDTVARD